MPSSAPEQSAREKIDTVLVAAGWLIQDYKALNLGAARGIAVREVKLKSSRCDYLLLVDRVPVGVIEAKREGVTLSAVADQSAHYAENLPDFLAAVAPGRLPFLYESTGIETLFRDERDPHPRSRPVFAFRSRSVGVTCVILETLPDANCSDLVLIQRPIGFVPQYGAYYMNSLAKRHIAAGKVGVTLIHFNTKSVAALAVPLLPLAEQHRIVAEVERRLSVIEELEAVVTASLQRATRLRQSILHRAFSRKL